MKDLRIAVIFLTIAMLGGCGDPDKKGENNPASESSSDTSSSSSPSGGEDQSSSSSSSINASSSSLAQESSSSTSSSAYNVAEKIERAKTVVRALNEWKGSYRLQEDFLDGIANPFQAIDIAIQSEELTNGEYVDFLQDFYTSDLTDGEALYPLIEVLGMVTQTLVIKSLNYWNPGLDLEEVNGLNVQEDVILEEDSIKFTFLFNQAISTCGLGSIQYCDVDINLYFDVKINNPSQATLIQQNTDRFFFGVRTNSSESDNFEDAEITYETPSSMEFNLHGSVQNSLLKLEFAQFEEPNLSVSDLLASFYQKAQNEQTIADGIRLAFSNPRGHIPLTLSEINGDDPLSIEIPLSLFGSQFDVAFEHLWNRANSSPDYWHWVVQPQNDFGAVAYGKIKQGDDFKIFYDGFYDVLYQGEQAAIYKSENCEALFCMDGAWQNEAELHDFDYRFGRAMIWSLPDQKGVPYTHTTEKLSNNIKEHIFALPFEDGVLYAVIGEDVTSNQLINATIHDQTSEQRTTIRAEIDSNNEWDGEILVDTETVAYISGTAEQDPMIDYLNSDQDVILLSE